MSRLSLRDVTKTFDGEPALDSISLTVADGEFFTLVGPSGCGKTTTLRVIAGLTDPEEGSVRIDGQSTSGVPPEDRAVGIVFQNYALFPHLTVAENVGYGLKFRDPPGGVTAAERVSELLDLVDLSGFADRDPETLSGGQQQRVALARALAPGPEILLLDEPMSALDARLRDQLRHTLSVVQSELDITTIYVTHDQREALAVSDRLAVLRDGHIEQVGRPETVYREPASRFVAAFLGETNLFPVDAVRDGRAVIGSGAEIAVAGGVSTGDVLAVRPEAMHLGRDENVLRPAVERVEFRGSTYAVHCRLDDQAVLVETERRPGEHPVLGFPSDAVRVLRESGRSDG
jgi:thiamine transport system ATP-binding protein